MKKILLLIAAIAILFFVCMHYRSVTKTEYQRMKDSIVDTALARGWPKSAIITISPYVKPRAIKDSPNHVYTFDSPGVNDMETMQPDTNNPAVKVLLKRIMNESIPAKSKH